jgi:hypothetical protein
MSDAAQVFLVILWIGGVVLAKGLIQTIFSVIFAPYAWYLVMEAWFTTMGWVQ